MNMKNLFKILLMTMIVLSFTALSYAEPVKKIPAKEGNFEIINGTGVIAPIDTKLMQQSIVKAATNLGWTVEKNEPGETTLKLAKGKSWWVIVKVCYTKNEYWYEYVDSYNLDAKPAKNKIHRNYTNKWIPNLERNIANFYFNPNQKPSLTIFAATIADDFTNVQGKGVITPIDTAKFKKAATSAASSLGWQIIGDKAGELTLRYSGGNWWVITKIVYNKDGYNYVYVDSQNLNANKEKKIIHKNYLGRWIPNLEKNIAVNYF